MLSSGIAITMLIVSVITVITTGYYVITLLREVFIKKRVFNFHGKSGILTLVLAAMLLVGIAYCLYNAPYVLFSGVSWLYIIQWGPTTLIYAVLCLAVVVPLIILYYLLNFFFPKENDKPYFMTIVLSIISAIGNSIVVFLVNHALNMSNTNESRTAATESGIYLYYILGIALFTICALVVRKKLIDITSDIIYEKRMEIIDKILETSYEEIEKIEDGSIQAVLNNDTEAISSFVNSFVNGLTGILTLITCYIYLGTQNFWGMFCSLLIVAVAVFLFLAVSSKAELKYQQNRDIQNTFFKHIEDMVRGFKELSISRRKKCEFKKDIAISCEEYKQTRREGDTMFLGVAMMGEVLYIAVIGIILFIFPLIFPLLSNATMRNYIVVYLYMGGIINQEVYLVPGLIRILVSYKRINSFISGLHSDADHRNGAVAGFEPELAAVSDTGMDGTAAAGIQNLVIELKDVCYRYEGDAEETFVMGPVNLRFESGEITFISGGNGSGKSTLAKILTGLYTPCSGEIRLNERSVDSSELQKYFTVIFSDYYLFDKMYGVDYEQSRQKAEAYLEKLKIRSQVQMEDGRINPGQLSTGQRKRLALVMSYLEDREIFLFDEWAADQDPEFRRFFYKDLLRELKEAGKMIIAITHDEKYFEYADQHIKMEYGNIVV